MTQAITSRRDGDTFQARLFWLRAACLLDSDSPIIRVGFETGPKAFDDIWVDYDPSRSPLDQEGRPLRREHVQCKWHVSPSTYGYLDVTDPEFINANARSLLQRAQAAQVTHAPAGDGVRFKLLTNWRIDRADPLRAIIGSRSSAIRLDRMFASTTDNSKIGALRQAWREHLGGDEEALRLLARTLAFAEAPDSLDDLRERLDHLFGFVGLRRIPARESAFAYDDVIYQWMAQGRLEFDRGSMREACAREGLLATSAPHPVTYGVKSFEHPIDRLEDRCVGVLDFTPDFDERFIRNDADWASKLYPAMKHFLIDTVAAADPLRLALDIHASLAFAAGSILNIKIGRKIDLEQRTTLRRVWSADDADPDPAWPRAAFNVVDLANGKPDIAVAIGLTHDIATDVRAFVERALPNVGRILVCQPNTGPSTLAVAGGRHAFDLAEAITAQIRATSSAGQRPPLHVFIAAPNAFTFFLGQRQPVLGKLTLYEFDFGNGRTGSYTPSLTLPVSN